VTSPMALRCDCCGTRKLAIDYGNKIVIKDGDHSLSLFKSLLAGTDDLTIKRGADRNIERKN
jgi:hypothetical protein